MPKKFLYAFAAVIFLLPQTRQPAMAQLPDDRNLFPQSSGMNAADTSDFVVPEGFAVRDTIVYRPAPTVDSTLAGKNIFAVLPSRVKGNPADVRVYQSSDILNSMNAHFEANRGREISGYRVRIFFDNKQTARNESQEVMERFSSEYHDVPVYRSYVNPYFKVTAGDFRSKSEAMQLLRRIRSEFPAAFIVREKSINYPAVDRNKAMVADTVRVLYRIAEETTI